jgi:Tol biopolymer transport system component
MLEVPEDVIDVAVMDCSANGKWILMGSRNGGQGTELYLGSLEQEKLEWTVLWKDSNSYAFARFSPDSRWFAFESTGSGQSEVYVAPVEGGPSARQLTVSVSGGDDPAWAHDGSKLYYRSLTGYLMVSKVQETGDGIEFSPPAQVMPLSSPRVGYLRNAYDLSPDGLSLVSIAESGGYNPAIRVRTGWRSW